MAQRTVLRLSLACDNRCVFCAQDGLAGAEAAAELPARLAQARALGDELTFVGGEPTLDPRLVDAVAAARQAGFSRVGIQTNGRRLADRAYTDALAAAGLTDAHLSIHGASAPVHDYHTGVPGSFDALQSALALLRERRIGVVAATVLTRSNFRVLAPLPAWLRARDVAAWLLEVPHVAGRAAAGFDRVVPRLGLALPFALHAMSLASQLGLPAWLRGAPACLLGSFAARLLPSEPRAYGAACATCEARPGCPGLDDAYRQRFDGDELHAVPSVARAAADATARMFVGAGERAMKPAETPRGPATARLSLPLLGKVQPARAEAKAAAPKRSGEALREIFPGLFDEHE